MISRSRSIFCRSFRVSVTVMLTKYYFTT
jgi:hypothetical protein